MASGEEAGHTASEQARVTADRLMSDHPAAVEDHEGVHAMLVVAFLHGVQHGAGALGDLIRDEMRKL